MSIHEIEQEIIEEFELFGDDWEGKYEHLIELGKSFDFMTYPDRTHGISEGPGTTVHVYHLLARYLTEHLPAGPQ